jgi:hypothetical protein
MKRLTKVVLGAACALALTATAASAEIACNREGDCWHVKARYEYHPDFGVTVHPDNWKWADRDKYRWREHEGRGYWRQGVWVEF